MAMSVSDWNALSMAIAQACGIPDAGNLTGVTYEHSVGGVARITVTRTVDVSGSIDEVMECYVPTTLVVVPSPTIERVS